jgi:hypothetical protein
MLRAQSNSSRTQIVKTGGCRSPSNPARTETDGRLRCAHGSLSLRIVIAANHCRPSIVYSRTVRSRRVRQQNPVPVKKGKDMPLVNTIKSKDERTSAKRAIDAYAPRSDQQSSGATVRVREGQRLDVDGILARSLPSPGAFAIKDIKTNVLR